MLTGDNGLLNQAGKAKEITGIAEIKEAIDLSVTSAFALDPLGDLTTENLETTLAQNMPTEYVLSGDETSGWTVEVPNIDKTYEIDSSGAIASIEPLKPEDTEPDSTTTFSTAYGIIDVIWLSGTSNTVTSTPNSPESHLSGMTGVYWEGTTETAVTDSNKSSWYSYTAGTGTTENTSSKWANAKNSDGSYFVWIPRYAYRITYYESQDAWINEEEATGYYDGYGMWNATDGTVKYALDSGVETVTYNGKKYIVHPAFMDDSNTGSDETQDSSDDYTHGGWSKDLEGFWVAKYEMSMEKSGKATTTDGIVVGNVITSDTVKAVSKPGVTSWRFITVGNIYTNSINYDTTKESHLMKNSEWGAVAYLTQSQYGRNGYEITINSNSSYYTGGGLETAYLTNTAQSSTGNETGIYDLSGGAAEYVAAWDASSSCIYSYGSSFASAGGTSTKYSTAYSNGENSYYGTAKEHEVGKVGDATKEVNTQGEKTNSHWFADASSFPYNYAPFTFRGGGSTNGNYGGIFYSNVTQGYVDSALGSRVVLCS